MPSPGHGGGNGGYPTTEILQRVATYLKWWRDGAIVEAELPEDIGDIIIILEQLAVLGCRRLGHHQLSGNLAVVVKPRQVERPPIRVE
jgi:hypothetical protein